MHDSASAPARGPLPEPRETLSVASTPPAARAWYRVARLAVVLAAVPAAHRVLPPSLAAGAAGWLVAAAVATVPGMLLAVALRAAGLAARTPILTTCAALGLSIVAYAAGREHESRPGRAHLARTDGPKTSGGSGTSSDPLPEGGIVVPYEGRGGAMVVEARVDGRGPFRFLFDTGATFTTLDGDTLRRLGRPPPDDGPRVEFHSASGSDSARALVLESVSLGAATVRGLVALHCEPCAQGGVAGLLGTNFVSRFEVTSDPAEQSLRLVPRDGPPNRVDEIRPFLDLSGTVWRLPGGGVRLDVLARNRGPRTLRRLTVLASGPGDAEGEAFTVALPDVPPGGESKAEARPPGGAPSTGVTLEPIEADW